MNRKKFVILYLASDFISSGLAWTLFFIFRKVVVEPAKYGYKVPIEFDSNFLLAIFILPTYWILFYWLAGSYKNIHKKSRLRELLTTLVISFIGTLFIFFLLLLDDEVSSYKVYRFTFLALLCLQFLSVAISRLTILTIIKSKISRREISFNTLIIGSNRKVLDLYLEFENEKHSQGYKFVGYTTVIDKPDPALEGHLQNLGTYHNLKKIISEYKIEVVIIAIDTSEHEKLNNILNLMEGKNVNIKIIPSMHDLISGKVKLNYLFGTALIDISPEILPVWQKNIKRFLDFFISLVLLIILMPLLLIIALAIKLSSTGPVIYKQERIGKNLKPFTIFKFRTMYINAEKEIPLLSSDNDPRVTSVGKFLRKYRLDEIPQFYNVLNGAMSLIGPRPERQFFIDQIIKIAPQYNHLLRVRPGITSWGQIKYGYAENVEQMVERVKYDILYIENMSLAMDLKIMFYTLLIIILGKGK